MAKLECMKCGAPVETTPAGRKDGRLVFHLGFSCDCPVLRPRELPESAQAGLSNEELGERSIELIRERYGR